jgi:hypothetical protein
MPQLSEANQLVHELIRVSYEMTNERGTRQKIPLVEYGGDNPAGVRFA